MAEREIDLLGEAMAATEREIFGEVMTGETEALDDSGDRSVEEMGDGLEGQHEDDEGGDEVEASGEKPAAEADEDPPRDKDGKFVKAEPEAKELARDPADKPRVPLGELQSERAKRQAAEAERDTDRKALADLNAKLDLALKQIETLKPKIEPRAGAEADDGPDIFTDPKAFVGKLTEGFQKQLDDVKAGTSMQLAHYKHGEAFERAYADLSKLSPDDGANRQLVQGIYRSANPGEAIVAWHRQQEASRRIGSDGLDKYEERVRAETRDKLAQDPEFRQQLIESMRAEGSGKGNPRPPIRLPKSLNGAAGGSQQIRDPDEFDNSETSVFGYAFR